MAGSADGATTAVGLTNGTLILSDALVEVVQESPADADDIETISHLVFRPDGVLLACRDSMGMTLDNRPENRMECWDHERGMIHMSELPARATSLLATESGAIVGCQNGAVIHGIVGAELEEITRFDNPISTIIEWGDDLIIGTWFHTNA